ncbi:MAG: hypothetical protein GY909_15335 [Oligoflexia bacterium]|nr:hypothetical protein [Oligoflexia bacterium]
MKKSLLILPVLAIALSSCGGSSGGGGSTLGSYNTPNLTASQFVDGLKRYDVLSDHALLLDIDETLRSQVAGQDDWFVIYDAKYDENKAFSLQYLRGLYYTSYYSDEYYTARSFRGLEDLDIGNGDLNGDFWGDDYEVVDAQYDIFGDFTHFEGRNSGFDYEDGDQTTDASLMVADKEEVQEIKRAANISFAFSMPFESARSLVTLGKKMGAVLNGANSFDQLTSEDQMAIAKDVENFTGVTLAEIMEASMDDNKKKATISKIAKKIGVSATNLEEKILPELVGLE